ncbi:MAG: chemotaxis protein CheX [Defluviitaleaceae bacterium]|nr:chemotaxis protein CheX [Defluviitaleaceae bacterium]
MNVAYVNPFVQGAQSVLTTLCMETPALGQVHVKNAPYAPSTVSIAVSIHGDFAGEVVFNMEESAGCFIASKMMMGMPVPALDAMSESALSELANMISGNVATLFSGKGIIVDIKPPAFRRNATNADFPLSTQTPKVVCVPLKFADGHVFAVDVMIP